MSKSIRDLLYYLWRADKTPIYEYPGNCRNPKQLDREAANRFGETPPRVGQRWWTPREKIALVYPGGINAILARARLPRARKGKP